MPVTVGQEVRFVAGVATERGATVEVELPDGVLRAVGVTDDAGIARFVPEQSGQHVFVMTIGSVRTMAPFYANPMRPRWSLAFGAVPLGLVLLWANLRRARGRRGP